MGAYMTTYHYRAPFGEIHIGINSRSAVTYVELFPGAPEQSNSLPTLPQAIADVFDAYFSDSKQPIQLVIERQVTPFQESVLQHLCTIPSGSTQTYGEIAKHLNTSPRAVGNACRRNPTPLLVPCHRVVSQTGLGGFAGNRSGKQLDVKTWLLQHEVS